jgi:hypothetical protein
MPGGGERHGGVEGWEDGREERMVGRMSERMEGISFKHLKEG